MRSGARKLVLTIARQTGVFKPDIIYTPPANVVAEVTDMAGNNTTEISDADAWSARLVSEVDERTLPQWAKDAIARGFPKSAVLMGYVKWDIEVSARRAYA